jgi:hypothetical protein
MYAENLRLIANKVREEKRAKDKAQSIRLLNLRISPLMKEEAEKGNMKLVYTVTDENINLFHIVEELEYREFEVKVNNRTLTISWE